LLKTGGFADFRSVFPGFAQTFMEYRPCAAGKPSPGSGSRPFIASRNSNWVDLYSNLPLFLRISRNLLQLLTIFMDLNF